jgi:uncharacterized membrane protein YedE/YeeE
VITLADVQAQSQWVLGLSFALAVLAGGVLHRSHFCTMGALTDMMLIGSGTRLRQWVLAVAIATLGFGAMVGMGLISSQNTIYANAQLNFVSLGLGGLLFGSGMVLASGCISKSLTRLGAGNLKSLVVLLVVGVSALATMRGLPAVWRVRELDPISISLHHGAFVGQWVMDLTGWTLATASVVSACGVGAALLFWVFKDAPFRSLRDAWPGLAVGSMVVAAWWISGVLGHVPEHPETLDTVFLTTASARMEAISMTAPVALWWDAWMYFSDGSKRLTLGMVWVPGLILGSFLSAFHEGSFRWEGFTQTPDLVAHLLGGLLMGVGGVMAMGCTFGQGLSGLSTLSWGSLLAVSGMASGAWLTLQWQMRSTEALA